MALLTTLVVRRFKSYVSPSGGPEDLESIPSNTRQNYGLSGVNIEAALLAGVSVSKLDKLRDIGDKSGCPCLVLMQHKRLDITIENEKESDESIDRLIRLTVAGGRLGCNAIGVVIKPPKGEDDTFYVVERLRAIMPRIERSDLNILLMPEDISSYHEEARELTDLVKQIGGFRIGVLPTFDECNFSENDLEELRRIAPFAGLIRFRIGAFDKDEKERRKSLKAAIDALTSIGYANTIALEYVGKGGPKKHITMVKKMLEEIQDGSPLEIDMDNLDAIDALEDFESE